MSLRTPLKNARGLGSAKEGADHFWKQRLTAVINVILSVYLVWLLVSLAGADHAAVKARLADPIATLALLILVVSATIHMRLGMQTILEDYVHGEGAKVVLLMLNTIFTIAVGAASVLALLKLSFGA